MTRNSLSVFPPTNRSSTGRTAHPPVSVDPQRIAVLGGADISELDRPSAIEPSGPSRHREHEWARDLAFEPATQLETIESAPNSLPGHANVRAGGPSFTFP